MKSLVISTSNRVFKFWEFISLWPSAEHRPYTTCDLKRQLIIRTFLALLCAPMFLIALIAVKMSSSIQELLDDGSPVVLVPAIQWLGFMLAILPLEDLVKTDPNILWVAYIAGPFVFVLSALIVTGIIMLLRKIFSKKKVYDKDGYPVPTKPSVLGEIYNGWKEKLCSRITYTE